VEEGTSEIGEHKMEHLSQDEHREPL